MFFLRSESTDPRWNLALEEYLFSQVPPGKSLLMLWQNDNTVVIGKNQNTLEEIDAAFVRGREITVVRRLSGGGAVYHDRGNLNFTFITDQAGDGRIDLHRFCRIVVDALGRLGVQGEVSGRNDVLVAGRKISGNAQYVRDGRVMHHGTILFDSDLTVISRVLRVRKEKLAAKGIPSVSSRVTNLKPFLAPGTTMEDLERSLTDAFSAAEALEPWTLSGEDRRRVQALREERYDRWEWNYGRSPDHTFRRRRSLSGGGTVQASVLVEGGRIGGTAFTGDFFGDRDVDGLIRLLQDCPYEKAAVLERIGGVRLEDYVNHMTADDLLALLALDETAPKINK